MKQQTQAVVKHKHALNAVVTIVEPGHTYSNWTAKFKEYGFRNTSQNLPFDRGTLVKVTHRDIHDDGTTPIYAVHAIINGEERECVIGEKGISPVPRKPMTEFVFKQVWPDLSLCHYDRENNVLHINGSGLGVKHGEDREDMVLRVYNPETHGYGDFKCLGACIGDYVAYLGYGISTTMRYYEDSKVYRDAIENKKSFRTDCVKL